MAVGGQGTPLLTPTWQARKTSCDAIAAEDIAGDRKKYRGC